jgi:hypothetical protein
MPTSNGRRRSSLLDFDLPPPEYVKPTSIENGRHKISKTVQVHYLEDNDDEYGISRLYHKRVFGLLVLQHSAMLFLMSPFVMMDPLQHAIQTNPTVRLTLAIISRVGIVATIAAAILRGARYPMTFICSISMTIFVALEFGVAFASGSLRMSGIIAIGQATISFSLILALLQFDLYWLSYTAAYCVSFAASLLWIMILLEEGDLSILACLGIGFGGFFYVALVFCRSFVVQKYVAPEEYVLGALFIYFPVAVHCAGSWYRNVESLDITTEGTPRPCGEKDCLLPR